MSKNNENDQHFSGNDKDHADQEKDKESLLRSAMCVLVNYKANKENLSALPYRRYLDLAVIYLTRQERWSDKPITNEQIDSLNITPKELDEAAINNTSKYGFTSWDFVTLRSEYPGPNPYADDPQRPEWPILVSNRKRCYGASILLFTNYFQILSMMGGDLWVFPISIHAVVVMPYNAADKTQAMGFAEKLRHDDPDEFLSKNMYLYRSDVEHFSIVVNR